MQGFQKVVGHQEIITHLQNAISMNKVSHAYLFWRREWIGKENDGFTVCDDASVREARGRALYGMPVL